MDVQITMPAADAVDVCKGLMRTEALTAARAWRLARGFKEAIERAARAEERQHNEKGDTTEPVDGGGDS